MRLLPLVLLAALAWPAVASAVTLEAGSGVADYEGVVAFSGSAIAGEPVHVYEPQGDRWHRVVSGTAKPDGSFRLVARVDAPGLYVARAPSGESAAVSVAMRPRLTVRLTGQPVVGGRLRLVGRIEPAGAGTLRLLVGGRERAVRTGPAGRFAVALPARKVGAYPVEVAVLPADGYVAAARALRVRIALPALALGSRGPGVRALEERLAALRYVLRGADGSYGADTFGAVLAFQKVHGLARTGRVDRAFWRTLARAAAPRPRASGGDHIEVDKSRQVLYEVRGGKVVAVVHVSTGATGNTPVGRWHVYRKVTGWDWVLWHPMYFLRGFAIHGYPSVPAYPASHGCVRVPMWFATGLYARWPLGATIHIFP